MRDLREVMGSEWERNVARSGGEPQVEGKRGKEGCI